jgi:hypothetical protein
MVLCWFCKARPCQRTESGFVSVLCGSEECDAKFTQHVVDGMSDSERRAMMGLAEEPLLDALLSKVTKEWT